MKYHLIDFRSNSFKQHERVTRQIQVPIINISQCSTVIANGYGRTIQTSLLTDMNREINESKLDQDDISLSKTSGKVLNRSFLFH